MMYFVRLLTATLAAIVAAPTATLAQALADPNVTPSVANGALIPPGLIVWLLAVAAILSAALLAVVDRKMRSGKTAI